ncbi:Sec-independent protein translocase protein TatB [Oceanicola sp. 502str15]|uniref:Sec-independent protein translocase protein TatB n=1 Tax=Oceanicola sp. 502str15 TaxID=2696061 RepID=UPI002094C479|nr:Sec-independent protein translocase protein TatB [Oceanicola sp. 502str15]MCO6382448.1 twin-arginine translocase subunit TatB [Oceanicola sp. 502str15]
MGWSELLLIGVVALIVVGPKDLPVMFQSLGKMTAKVKRMAREFSRAMEDAADSTGMKDVASDLNRTMNPKSMGIDKLRDAADRFDKWDPSKKEPEKKAMGPETSKLSEERAEAKRKIQEASAKAAEERKRREAIEASEAAEMAGEPEGEQAVNGAEAEVKPAPKKAPAKKPAAKKHAAKSAPKTAAKKAPAAKKTPAKSKPKPAPKSAAGDTGVS